MPRFCFSAASFPFTENSKTQTLQSYMRSATGGRTYRPKITPLFPSQQLRKCVRLSRLQSTLYAILFPATTINQPNSRLMQLVWVNLLAHSGLYFCYVFLFGAQNGGTFARSPDYRIMLSELILTRIDCKVIHHINLIFYIPFFLVLELVHRIQF